MKRSSNKGVVAGRERERLTLKTLGLRKWRKIEAEIDCDAWEESGPNPKPQPPIFLKSNPKGVNRSKTHSNQSLEAKIRENMKKWRRMVQKLKCENLLKTSNPDEPVHWSWSGRPSGYHGQHFDFSIFAHFLIL